jgi:hypothetical protein
VVLDVIERWQRPMTPVGQASDVWFHKVSKIEGAAAVLAKNGLSKLFIAIKNRNPSPAGISSKRLPSEHFPIEVA